MKRNLHVEAEKPKDFMKNINRTVSAIALLFVFLAASAISISAQGREREQRREREPVRIVVSGIGITNDPDQSTADANAYNQATLNANQICPGFIENGNYEKTADVCVNVGSSDSPLVMCTVTVKAICVNR
jgi:hypothetical protein